MSSRACAAFYKKTIIIPARNQPVYQWWTNYPDVEDVYVDPATYWFHDEAGSLRVRPYQTILYSNGSTLIMLAGMNPLLYDSSTGDFRPITYEAGERLWVSYTDTPNVSWQFFGEYNPDTFQRIAYPGTANGTVIPWFAESNHDIYDYNDTDSLLFAKTTTPTQDGLGITLIEKIRIKISSYRVTV